MSAQNIHLDNLSVGISDFTILLVLLVDNYDADGDEKNIPLHLILMSVNQLQILDIKLELSNHCMSLINI